MLKINKDRHFDVSGKFLAQLIALGDRAQALALEELRLTPVGDSKLDSTDKHLYEAGFPGNQVIHSITVSDLAYELSTRSEFDPETLDSDAIARLMHHTNVALDRAGDGFEFGAEITHKAVQYFLEGCNAVEQCLPNDACEDPGVWTEWQDLCHDDDWQACSEPVDE